MVLEKGIVLQELLRPCHVTCGVSHGSILVAILYIILTCFFYFVTECYMQMHEDDTHLLFSFYPSYIRHLKITISQSKRSVILFGRRNERALHRDEIYININDTFIQFTHILKYLRMNWTLVYKRYVILWLFSWRLFTVIQFMGLAFQPQMLRDFRKFRTVAYFLLLVSEEMVASEIQTSGSRMVRYEIT